jgi:hypothetical protein
MAWAVLICLFISILYAQQSAEAILAQVRAKVADSIGRLSNYMCTQTIERMTYVLPSAPKALSGVTPQYESNHWCLGQ